MNPFESHLKVSILNIQYPPLVKARSRLVDGASGIAGLAGNGHKVDPSDTPQPVENANDAPKIDTEKQVVDESRKQAAKPPNLKVWKEKQKARTKLLKSQQGQLMRIGQTSSALDAVAQSTGCLEKAGFAKNVDVLKDIAGNTLATVAAHNSTGISTRRGLRKPHREVKSTGQGQNEPKGDTGSKAVNLNPTDVQNTANAILTTDKAKDKFERPRKLSRPDRLVEKHEPPYAQRWAKEGSESMYQQHNRTGLNIADSSLCSLQVTTQVSSIKKSLNSSQPISKCSNTNLDRCAEHNRESNIALTSTALPDLKEPLSDVLGEQSVGFESLSHAPCPPHSKITGDHRPLSEPSGSSTKLDTTIFGKIPIVFLLRAVNLCLPASAASLDW